MVAVERALLRAREDQARVRDDEVSRELRLCEAELDVVVFSRDEAREQTALAFRSRANARLYSPARRSSSVCSCVMWFVVLFVVWLH